MSVSGNEESGVKSPPPLHPSFNIAGVPIKKRRFIPIKKRRFDWPSSPPPEEQASPAVQEELDRPSEDSAPSNANVAASSSGLVDMGKNFAPNEDSRHPVGAQMDTSNDLKVKIEEAGLTMHSNSLSMFDIKEKLTGGETSVNILMKKSELSLSNNAPVFGVNKEKENRIMANGTCKSEMSSGNPDLSLGLKKHPVSSLDRCSNDGNVLKHDSGESLSLNCKLSKGESSIQFQMGVKFSNTDTANNVCANRSNWDLNTTMDAWEGSDNDATVGQVTDSGSNIVVPHEMKVTECSAKVIETGVLTEKQLLGMSDCRSSTTTSQSSEPCNSQDSLHLSLTPSLLSLSSSQAPCRGVVSQRSLPTGLLTVNVSNIKLEPPEESLKHDFSLAKTISTGPIETSAVKPELVVKFPLAAVASSDFNPQKIVSSKLIKPEPFHDSSVGRLETQDGMLGAAIEDNQIRDSEGDHMGDQNGCSMNRHVLQVENTSEQPTCLTDNSIPLSEDIAAKLACTKQLFQKDVSETVEIAKDKDAGNSECNITSTILLQQGCDANADCCVTDEEKVNLSGDMIGESSCSLGYESDGNSVPMDIDDEHEVREDIEDGEVREPHDSENKRSNLTPGEHGGVDDFEDGEVRELQQNDTSLEGKMCEKGGVVISCGVVLIEKANSPRVTGYDYPTLECVDASLDGKASEDMGKDICEGTLFMTKIVQRHPLDTVVEDAFMDQVTEKSYKQARSRSPVELESCTHDTKVDVETDGVEKKESSLPKIESFEEKFMETHNGDGRSSVINLSGASNFPYGNTSSMSGRSFPSHPGRERLPDVPLVYDKLHPRGRDELYNAGFHKFSRGRHQDQFPRNTRLNFDHGRGRMSGRIDSLHGDRESERDFDSELYAGPSDFGAPRHKFASAVARADAEFINHNNGQDGSFSGNVRGGRKILDDDTPIFRELSSRRYLGGRDGPVSRNFTMARRVQRNIDEDSSEAVRHSEKMMRGFPEDGTKHTYTRPQHYDEGLDRHFVQGTRNFSSGPRRDLPQIRSKSPVRSRSPGPWSSSRRRSPEGYGGHRELPHRRSPLYRMERIRSPDHTGFPREPAVRRNESPSYMSRANDRDMDSGHTRPIMPNRSQTGRIFLRNNRRFISDPRDRADGEELYGGPMHSGRFQDLDSEGNEEIGRFLDRRGSTRSFRPSFNTDGENFHQNPEDGPRPFRFVPDDNAEFHGRANLREREFDRHITNHPGNETRRPRGTEEQEGNYRPSGQVLYHDEFDEASRVKRKRF